MTRFQIMEALKALGGKGTGKQIQEQLIKLYPDDAIQKYYYASLNRLVIDGTIKREGRSNPTFTIVGTFERNVYMPKKK